jgi:hypothetical protein
MLSRNWKCRDCVRNRKHGRLVLYDRLSTGACSAVHAVPERLALYDRLVTSACCSRNALCPGDWTLFCLRTMGLDMAHRRSVYSAHKFQAPMLTVVHRERMTSMPCLVFVSGSDCNYNVSIHSQLVTPIDAVYPAEGCIYLSDCFFLFKSTLHRLSKRSGAHVAHSRSDYHLATLRRQ